MSSKNNEYWKTRDGELYADQQRVRRAAGNDNYARQEQWLAGFVAERHQALGRPVRVLDFGVGFGRLAHVLAGQKHVDYYGYDISEAMVAPLLAHPPAGLGDDITRRIRVGPRLDEAMAGCQFDVIFTVSVLIHNDRDQAAQILAQMRSLLAPDGRICLIENRPVSISLMANLWHNGCWSHDVAGTLAADMNVDVEDGILADHGIYILSEPAQPQGRQVRVPGSSGFAPVSAGDYLLRCRQATQTVAQGLEAEVANVNSDLAYLRDASELYQQAEAAAVKALQQARGLLAEAPDHVPVVDGSHLTSAIAALPALAAAVVRLSTEQRDALEVQARQQQQALEAEQARDDLVLQLQQHQEQVHSLKARVDQLTWQLELRQRVLGKLRDPIPVLAGTAAAAVSGQGADGGSRHGDEVFEFNAPRDTCHAQNLPGHERVCHVMHKEWFGIRAASGALPGQKLAISGVVAPSIADIEEVVALLAGKQVNRLALHGFSSNMATWARALHAAGFDHISLVWHGAPVMWVHEEERRLFGMALDLARKGILRRINGMRAGTHAVMDSAYAWVPQIYNMPPNYRPISLGAARRRPDRGATVFAPSWNLVHKNLFTNVAAAASTPEVGSIWLLADDFQLPYPVDKELKKLPKLDQKGMMDAMSLCDVVMNASIVDCHPMVELEALAAGTPAIRGRLGMDALDDHPYVQLTQVGDPLNVADVRSTLQRVLRVPTSELQEMMTDYSRAMVQLSFERYSEFLEA